MEARACSLRSVPSLSFLVSFFRVKALSSIDCLVELMNARKLGVKAPRYSLRVVDIAF